MATALSADSLKLLSCVRPGQKEKNKICNYTATMLNFCLQCLISFYIKSAQILGRTFFGLEFKLKNELQSPSGTI